MIHKYNIAELSLVDRPIESTKCGFGSVIPQHNDLHDRRYFRTENRDFYGGELNKSAGQTTAEFKAVTSNLAGTHMRYADEQRTKLIANLVGENYNKEQDP